MAPRLMKLTVNGESREIPDGSTVADLLARLNVKPERVAVEVNMEVVRRARHNESILASGDQVEVVTFVGGG